MGIRERIHRRKVAKIKNALTRGIGDSTKPIRTKLPRGTITIYRVGGQVEKSPIGVGNTVTKAYRRAFADQSDIIRAYIIADRLSRLGAPIARPLKPPYWRGGLLVWKEEQIRGKRIAAIKNPLEKVKAQKAFRRASMELRKALDSLGLDIDYKAYNEEFRGKELEEANAIFDKKTGQATFIDPLDLYFYVKESGHIPRWILEEEKRLGVRP